MKRFEYYIQENNKQTKLLCKIVYLWIIFYIFKVSKEWSAILDKIRVESKVYFHCCIHHLSNVLCRPVNFSQFFRHFQFHIRPLCTEIYELEDCSLDKISWENIAGDNYVYIVNKCLLRYITQKVQLGLSFVAYIQKLSQGNHLCFWSGINIMKPWEAKNSKFPNLLWITRHLLLPI